MLARSGTRTYAPFGLFMAGGLFADLGMRALPRRTSSGPGRAAGLVADAQRGAWDIAAHPSRGSGLDTGDNARGATYYVPGLGGWTSGDGKTWATGRSHDQAKISPDLVSLA